MLRKKKPRHFDLLLFLHVYTNIMQLMQMLNMQDSIRLQNKVS